MAVALLALALAGCWEEERHEARREVCSAIDRQTEEALAARDRANAGLTGGAKTPRVPTCQE